MKPLFAALALLPSLALAQAAPPLVSLDARGEDVREVFATLFAQVHKPYALDAAIKGKLYVTLDRMPYAKALNIVLTQAGLAAKERDGVVLVTFAPKPVVPPAAPVAKPIKPPVAVPKEAAPAFDPKVYAHHVTTRMPKAPLADVFAAFGEQAATTIELDPAVPAYRIDAYFVNTSLRYALDRVCKATGLAYSVQNGKIRVTTRETSRTAG